MALFSRRSKEDHLVARYRRKAQTYDRHWARYTVGTLFRTLESLGLEGHEHLLDIGCGTGELERILLPRWPQLRITALDLSAHMLDVATEKFSPAFHLDFLRSHAQFLPFPDGVFDVVVNLNAFHYFSRPVETLREFRRVLAPGGSCVLTDWCTDAWRFKLIDFGMRLLDPTHNRLQGVKQLSKVFSEASFRDQRIDTYRVGWFWEMMTIRGIASASAATTRAGIELRPRRAPRLARSPATNGTAASRSHSRRKRISSR